MYISKELGFHSAIKVVRPQKNMIQKKEPLIWLVSFIAVITIGCLGNSLLSIFSGFFILCTAFLITKTSFCHCIDGTKNSQVIQNLLNKSIQTNAKMTSNVKHKNTQTDVIIICPPTPLLQVLCKLECLILIDIDQLV